MTFKLTHFDINLHSKISLIMAKESKKQIKAQLINEISTKYSKKIKELEEDKRRAIDSWSRLVEKKFYITSRKYST